MKLRHVALSMGLESFEPNPSIADQVGIDSTNSVADELLEMNDAAQEADMINDVKEEALEVVEGLESLVAQIACSLESRGLSPEAAAFANMHASSLCSRIGLKVKSAGTEAYENGATRISVTRAGLEDLKGMLKDVWAWIIDLLTKAKKASADFFNRVLGTASRLEAAALKQVDQANKTTGAFKETTVEIPTGMVGRLHIQKAIPSNMSASLSVLNTVAEDIFNAYAGSAITYAEELVKSVEKADPSKEGSLGEIATALTAAIGKAPSLSSLTGSKPTGTERYKDAGFTYKFSDELMGGKMIVSQVAGAVSAGTEDDEQDAVGVKPPVQDKVSTDAVIAACRAAASSTINLTSYEDKAQDLKEVKVAAYQSSEVAKLAEIVAGFAGVVNRYRNKAEDSNKAKDVAIKAAKSLEQSISRAKELASNESNAFSAISKLLAAVPNLVDQPKDGYAAYLMAVGNEVLRMNAKMLSNIKQS